MQQSLRICFIWADKIAHSSPESHTDPYAIMEWYIPNHSCVWIGRRICASAVTDCRLFCLCPIRSASLPCDGTRTDAHSSNRKASRHSIGWPFLSCRLGKMRCATIALGYCISIFFGCNSGRFFIVTVSIPFSILAVRVARSALSGISALMA